MKNALKKLVKSEAGWAVNKQICKWFCHTNIGVQFHIFGYNDIRRAQKTYPGNSNKPAPLTVGEFRKNGYASKQTPYPAELMKSIREKFAILIEDEKNFTFDISADYQGPRNVRRVLNDPLDKIPELSQLLDDNVRAHVEGYYKSYFKVLRIIAWRNYHVPAEHSHHEALSNFWHFDQCTTALFNLFINISDVTEKDGPFHILPRKRSDALVRTGYKNRYDYGLPLSVLEDASHVVKLTGPPGTAMYASTPTCLHRAGIPEKGRHRDIVSFQFMPANTRLPDDWAEHFIDHGPLK